MSDDIITPDQISDYVDELIRRFLGSDIVVDLDELAQEMDLKIKYFNPQNDKDYKTRGTVDYKNNKVYINNTEETTKKRFTLAHMIGHFVMHQGSEMRVDLYSKSLTQHEKEANDFALKLLMPEDDITRVLKEITDRPIEEKVELVAQYFHVPVITATIRLVKLGYE